MSSEDVARQYGVSKQAMRFIPRVYRLRDEDLEDEWE